MAAKGLILDFSEFDTDRVIDDLAAIRELNPQRQEMEQLTAVVHEDRDRSICVGYKDVTDSEFWVRGHMPGIPLMPGVLMCEAAAQLCSFFSRKYDLLGVDILAFGGLDGVRFRELVRPGDRLVIVAEMLKVRRGAMITCRFQEFVGQTLVCEGTMKGVPLPLERIAGAQAGSRT